jgi:4-amino-4-deoxy-L-arabinose transferase-like glycosyltransferase
LYQGLSVSRRWLALVLILFCLPLFIGLRSLDLETDEAIYSFAVDRILEVGDWLEPKSSPSETAIFLEKPPLKFWIVAAPIRAGLLPHDEFGLRFWDALFGTIGFAYVFAIGSRLAGPICGAVAVLSLFVHWPLLFEHGLRTNSMEAPLFLSYCGGVYHFLEWGGRRTSRPGLHALSVGLYVTLGFMTKFVAVVFLPGVLGLGALLFRPTRRRLLADWKLWTAVAGLVFLLVVPWFVYAQIKFGSLVWHTMLAEHVYARFTVGLNQEHIHPWSFYFSTMWEVFTESRIQWLMIAGSLALLAQTLRRRWFEGTVILLWGVLPLSLISLGSSKLYHYAYPFLPPVAIAFGYLVGLVVELAPVVARRLAEAIEDALARIVPGLRDARTRPWTRRAGTTLIGLATLLAVWALLFGQARVAIGDILVFKSSGVLRPIVVIAAAALLTRRSASVATLVVALSVAWWMPIDFYKSTLVRLTEEKHPLRDTSQCILRVEATAPGIQPGLFVDTDRSMWHPILYYFRRIQPWTRQDSPSPDALDRNLHDPGAFKPSLVEELRYRGYLAGPARDRLGQGGSPPMMSLLEYALLLPGPYSVCSSEARLRASH